MRELFLLGAGFSRAVSAGMPLTRELGERLRTAIPFPDEKQRATAFTDDFEIWLTYLAQPHPWLTEADNLRNRAHFLDVSAAIGKILCPGVQQATREGFPTWLQNLVCYWHEKRLTVLSLNYDTLIEECLPVFPVRDKPRRKTPIGIISGVNYRPGLKDIYSVPLEYDGPDTVFQKAPERDHIAYTFRLLKPHGSINWFYSASRTFTAEPVYVSMREAARRWCRGTVMPPLLPQPTEGLSCVIAPPIADKSPYFENRVISAQWKAAASALLASDRVYCLGYSLPETDLTLRFWLAGAHRKEKPTELWIVNRDDTCIEHYHRVLPDCYRIDEVFAGGDDAIARFVGTLIEGDPNILVSSPGDFRHSISGQSSAESGDANASVDP